MQFYRPTDRLAGFMVNLSEDERELPFCEAGEMWVPCDWKIGWHQNEGWEVYYQPEGHSVWQIDDRTYTLGHHGWYVMPPRLRHRLQSFQSESAHFTFAVIPEACLENDLRQEMAKTKGHSTRAKGNCFGAEGHSLAIPFQGFIRELSLDESHQSHLYHHYVHLIMWEVVRLRERQQATTEKELIDVPATSPQRRRALPHPITARARELLLHNLGHPWKLDELAALCAISIPHLIELFRREYGQTPKRFLQQARLEEVRRRLEDTDQPVTQIAYDLGFSSSQHLAQTLRQHLGTTARALREKRQLS